MKYHHLLFISLLCLLSCSDDRKTDPTINKINLSNHPYWGLLNPNDVTSFDTIKIPLFIDASIFIDDISEFHAQNVDIGVLEGTGVHAALDQDITHMLTEHYYVFV